MYKRSHHKDIAQILSLLNGSLLQENACYFAGGTAIALRYGEFRESVDMDFLVSDAAGYRNLRQSIKKDGLSYLTKHGALEQINLAEVRADQYGIRSKIQLRDQWIKFEIVSEGRIELCKATKDDEICQVPCLTPLDMVASKLLANSDRWLDRGVFSRDIIDLGMMSPTLPLLKKAIQKAELAYGQTIIEDLEKAIHLIKNDKGWLERCMEALAMDLPKAVLWQKISFLKKGCIGNIQ